MISLIIFVVVVVFTIRICARKEWPLWVGLGLGVFGQILGRTAFLFLALVIASIAPPLAVIALLAPFVGILTPIVIAHALPSRGLGMGEGETEVTGEIACPHCGRVVAATTKVCPRCMKKIEPYVVHSEEAGMVPPPISDDNPYAPPQAELRRPTDPAEETATTAFCSVCKKEVRIDADERCTICKWPVD